MSIPEHSDQFGLFSNDPKDLEWGFSKTLDKNKKFRKNITLQELDWVFEQETTVKYQGNEFKADHIAGKYIMLNTNDKELSVKHRMEEWRHGEYRLPVDMKDVDEIVIKWTPLKKYYSNQGDHTQAPDINKELPDMAHPDTSRYALTLKNVAEWFNKYPDNSIYVRVKNYQLRVDKYFTRNNNSDEIHVVMGIDNYSEDIAESYNFERTDKFLWEGLIPLSDVACVYYFDEMYEPVALFGKLFREDSDPQIPFMNYINKYCKNGQFAIFRGKEYTSHRGINQLYEYVIFSYDPDSQNEGFVALEPYVYYRRVKKEYIELCYNSQTWCMYEGERLFVEKSDGINCIIRHYDLNDHKTVPADSIQTIWEERKGTQYFPQYKETLFLKI